MSKSYFVAAESKQVLEDTPFAAKVEGRQIGLYRISDGIHAIDNICPHQYALLTDGYLEDGCIECPIHQARFDIRTGAVLCGPAECDVRTYPVKIQQGLVLVELDDQ